MCIECGCNTPLPFGVRVLRAIAPSLVQTRKNAGHGDESGGLPVGAASRRDAESDDNPSGRKAPPTVGRQLAAASDSGKTTAASCLPTHSAKATAASCLPTTSADATAASCLPTAETTSPTNAGSAADVAASATHTLELHAPLLARNDEVAARNRALFAQRKLVALNLVSSPGAGKTTLLSRTVDEFGLEYGCAVVVGDLETDNDARRIHRPHVPVVQITTGTACHLDAEMVARGVAALSLAQTRVLFIENVGNLVCPAAFDLGESVRVVLLSATEGEDKPLKYPPIFKSAHLVLLTKIDVAEALGFDRTVAVENIRRIAPQAELIELAARSGEGMERWYEFLRRRLVE